MLDDRVEEECRMRERRVRKELGYERVVSGTGKLRSDVRSSETPFGTLPQLVRLSTSSRRRARGPPYGVRKRACSVP